MSGELRGLTSLVQIAKRSRRNTLQQAGNAEMSESEESEERRVKSGEPRTGTHVYSQKPTKGFQRIPIGRPGTMGNAASFWVISAALTSDESHVRDWEEREVHLDPIPSCIATSQRSYILHRIPQLLFGQAGAVSRGTLRIIRTHLEGRIACSRGHLWKLAAELWRRT